MSTTTNRNTTAARSKTSSTTRSMDNSKTSSKDSNKTSSKDSNRTSSKDSNRTSRSTSQRRKRRKSRRQQQMENNMKLTAVIAVVILLVFVIFWLRGCARVKHDSPKRVVRSLIQAYEKENEKMIKDCYGQKENTEESLLQEINASLDYIKAHNAKEIKVRKCDTLDENGDEAYVYILYSFVLDNEQEYPCLDTYMVRKLDNNYYILSPAGITDEMSERAVAAFTKFMTTDIYKDYMKEYNTFIKKNPGYEEKIAGILGE